MDQLSEFQDFVAERREPSEISELRRQAAARFSELGFPTLRQEEWRFTNVAPIARTRFHRATELPELSSETATSQSYPECHLLVFANGQFLASHSETDALPPGVVVGSLRRTLEQEPALVEPHLGRFAKVENHPFAALNTAFFDDGAFVSLARGTVLDKPVHLLFLSGLDPSVHDGSHGSNGAPTVSYPRNLIVAGPSTQATIIESYVGLGSHGYFNCGVTEIVGEDNSVVDHYKLQKEGHQAYHIATQQVYLGRDANFSSHSISQGGGLVRNDINAVLDAEGVDCTLNGLYIVTGRQHVDNQMRVEHAKPHCSSHELYKGILDGEARAVFNGRIYVHPQAQKTDAKQTNRNLLLSKGALVNSNPQLEIFADDVKCTHGSTVGQLDSDALFYLRSRGIAEEAARGLLTYAFASEFVERIKVAPLRTELEEFLFSRLPGGEVVRQAI